MAGHLAVLLPAIIDLDEVVGPEATEMVMRSGDLRHGVDDPAAHICQMFRWSDVQALLQRAGGRSIGASASNWASLGDAQALARLEAHPGSWQRFVEHEVAACAQPGVLDGGTHILFAARRADVITDEPSVGVQAGDRDQ